MVVQLGHKPSNGFHPLSFLSYHHSMGIAIDWEMKQNPTMAKERAKIISALVKM